MLFLFQYYVVRQILQYLNWEEVSQLMVASPARDEIKKELLENEELFRRVFEINTKKDWCTPVGLFKISAAGLRGARERRVNVRVSRLDSGNLLTLEPEELLALRLDLGGNTVQHQTPLLLRLPIVGERFTGLERVAFNPVHPIVAVSNSETHLSVHSYSGDGRFDSGSLLFSHMLRESFDQVFHFYDRLKQKITGLSWSPDGSYLLANLCFLSKWRLSQSDLRGMYEEGKVQSSLLLFEYREGQIRQLIFKAEEMRYDGCMLSHCQWLDESSFLLAAPPYRTGLYRFQISRDERVGAVLSVVRLITDCHSPYRGFHSDIKFSKVSDARGAAKRQFMRGHRILSYVGAYFGLDRRDGQSVFGFVTNCPKLHPHQRIVVLTADDCKSQNLWGTIDVPGVLLSLEVHEKKLYILYLYEEETEEGEPPEVPCLRSVNQDCPEEQVIFDCPLTTRTRFSTAGTMFWMGAGSEYRYGLAVYDYLTGSLEHPSR